MLIAVTSKHFVSCQTKRSHPLRSKMSLSVKINQFEFIHLLITPIPTSSPPLPHHHHHHHYRLCGLISSNSFRHHQQKQRVGNINIALQFPHPQNWHVELLNALSVAIIIKKQSFLVEKSIYSFPNLNMSNGAILTYKEALKLPRKQLLQEALSLMLLHLFLCSKNKNNKITLHEQG